MTPDEIKQLANLISEPLIIRIESIIHQVNRRDRVCVARGKLLQDLDTKFKIFNSEHKMEKNSWRHTRSVRETVLGGLIIGIVSGLVVGLVLGVFR